MDWSLVPLACFAALALHPFLTFPLSLLAFERRPLSTTPGGDRSIALLFCCHNEEKTLPAKLKNLKVLLAKHPRLSVHVFLDGCTDRSAELLKGHDRINVISADGRNGKNFGLNVMMKGVKADLVAFNDANVVIDDAAFANIQRYFTDDEVGCVCAHLRYLNDDDSATAKVGGLYWKFEEWLKRRETEIGSTVAVDGSLFFIRRELFTQLPIEVPNDFFTSLDILTRGFRVISADDVRCFENSATSRSDEFKRKVRITTRAVTTHLKLRSRISASGLRLRYIYTSHKYLRWFEAYWLALTYVALALWATRAGYTVEFMAASAVAALVWLIGNKLKAKLALQLTDIMSAFVATAYGATRAYTGARVKVWAVPASSR